MPVYIVITNVIFFGSLFYDTATPTCSVINRKVDLNTSDFISCFIYYIFCLHNSLMV
jgi:hypothetical protein